MTFCEGPTQVTLPQHKFEQKLQLALLDGIRFLSWSTTISILISKRTRY